MFKKLVTVLVLLSPPAAAQATLDPIMRFVGVLGDLRFSAGYVRADLVALDDSTAQLAIAMNHEAGAQFANFTMTHANQSAAFSICGVQMTDLVIDDGNSSGFVLTNALPSETAEVLAAVINDEQACPMDFANYGS